MTPEKIKEGNDRKIHFTINLDDDSPKNKKPEKKKPALFSDETTILDKLNLVYKVGERNTEHGVTSITVIDFHDDEQHKKALCLLTQHYSRILWRVLPLLRKLGRHLRADVRYRTAQAVGELMSEMDFIRIKDEIIIPWANSDDLGVNANVGLAFSVVIKHEKYAENIKKLLKHWTTVSNPDLNRTALAASIPLCTTWPEDTMEIVRKALGRENADPWDYSMQVSLAAFVMQELCNNEHSPLVIDSLKDWLLDTSAGELRLGAALAFLQAVDLSHALAYDGGKDKIISLYQVCLEERRLDNLGLVRDEALKKLKEWVEDSWGDDEKEEFIKTLFMRLYLRSTTDRDKDRIIFHLNKWQRQDKEKRFGFILESIIR